jgi:hypothetical protein
MAENEVLRVCSVWRDVGQTGLDRVRIVIRPVASFLKGKLKIGSSTVVWAASFKRFSTNISASH